MGIEAVSFNHLDALASGLPVLSRHPRYWSIYTYIVKQFWDRGRTPQTNAALGRFLKPREVVFACASLVCERDDDLRHGELPGIIGRDTFVPYLREARSELPLDLAYLRQSLGAMARSTAARWPTSV